MRAELLSLVDRCAILPEWAAFEDAIRREPFGAHLQARRTVASAVLAETMAHVPSTSIPEGCGAPGVAARKPSAPSRS